jgi:hypothetical protein
VIREDDGSDASRGENVAMMEKRPETGSKDNWNPYRRLSVVAADRDKNSPARLFVASASITIHCHHRSLFDPPA